MKRTIIACIIACAGCAHEPPPRFYIPPSTQPLSYTPLPVPSTDLAQNRFDRQEYPCGREMEVHVGEADVNLPKLDLTMGTEGKIATQGYVLHLKDAEFHILDYCKN